MKWTLLLLRGLVRTALVALGGVLALYVALVVINWKDQPPNQASARYNRYYADRPQVADRENGYVFMLGFAAPRHADPEAAGVRRRDWMLAQMAAPVFDPQTDPLPDDARLLGTRSEVAGLLSRACNTAGTDCLLALGRQPEGLATWLTEERWLLDRYQLLIRHERWQEVSPFDVMASLPPFHVAFEGQKLQLAQAYELARAGKPDDARELAEADARFWLMMLANADTLISKMIALRGAERNMLWTSLISRQLPPAQMQSVVPEEWLKPLERQHCSLWQVMAGEWLFSDRLVRQASNSPRQLELLGEEPEAIWRERAMQAVQAPLWQSQDASNRLADAYLDIGTALDMECADGGKAIARARASGRRAGAATPWYHPYNLPFNMISASGMGDFAEYGARVADLDAMRQALLVTIQMRRQQVSPARLAEALSASTLRNPIGGKPYTWEEASGTITFQGLADDTQGWYHFPY